MELIDHILTALAVLCAAAAAWFARRAKPSKQQEGAQLAATAVDYADAHPSPGISRERTALDAYRLGDLRDGKRDFSDAQALVFIRAEIARRSK